MTDTPDYAASATLMAVAALLDEAKTEIERAAQHVRDGNYDAALGTLITFDPLSGDAAILKQAAQTLLRKMQRLNAAPAPRSNAADPGVFGRRVRP